MLYTVIDENISNEVKDIPVSKKYWYKCSELLFSLF